MASIAELIEKYIKKLIQDSSCDYIEFQRNELAAQFKCVPSQINYVLSTRFTNENGYIVESRRGGGGYIRIIKIPLDRYDDPVAQIYHLVGDNINQSQAEKIIKRLFEEKIITNREAHIFRAVIDKNILPMELSWRHHLRAQLLRAMLGAIFRES